MLSVNKQMSLVERKKLQWAQERAEMESLHNPWGMPPPAFNMKFSESRSRFASTLEIRNTCPPTAQKDLVPRRQRSPSLPPILRMQGVHDSTEMELADKQGTPHNAKYRFEDGEGETSGYASESAPQSSPEYWNKVHHKMNDDRKFTVPSQDGSEIGRHGHPITACNYSERSNSEDRSGLRKSGREEESRPRWGDRGVAVGRLWEPQDADARLPQMYAKGPPSWVERGLNTIDNREPQILVIDQMSNSSTIEAMEIKTGNNADRNTYLLGQNVPIEPNIKAERETKRLKALELQAAIMQQLEERTRKKREEKERRIREEREEEERFIRQRDLERQRLQEERRIAEEKQQKEQKRAEALRQALEKAEQQAKIEKENKKMKRIKNSFDSMSINSEVDPPKDPNQSPKKSVSQQSTPYKESKLIQNIFIEQAFSPRRKIIQDSDNTSHKSPSVASETNIIMSNPPTARFSHPLDNYNYDQQLMDINKRQQSDSASASSQGNPAVSLMTDNQVSLVPIPLPHEMFTPVHIAHGTGLQMAFLMPQHVNTALYPCVHQSMNMQPIFQTDTQCPHQKNHCNVQPQTTSDECCSNREQRVLTPSKYRNQNCRDASTQTDFEYNQNKVDENKDSSFNKNCDNLTQIYNPNNSEEKLNSLTLKKDKKIQPEEKYRELENRPKWGVNKPPTQYKKQSEKDIFYTQKRKLRSRKRIQEKQYTSHSSDENRSPSPPREVSKHYHKIDKNRVSMTENYWRKRAMQMNKTTNLGNLSIETIEISPLECDKSGLVRISDNSNSSNLKKMFSETRNISKRGITLSQKFMNDKYGNPKLWSNDNVDNNNTNEMSIKHEYKNEMCNKFKEKLENRKEFLDNINNKTRKEQSTYYCEDDIENPVLLNQLRSLKDSLKKQQKIWGKYDPNNRSPSPKNEVDLEID